MWGPLFPVWPFDLTPWPLLSFEGHSTLLFYYTRLRNILGAFLLRFFYCLVYSDLLKIYFIRARSRVILETWGVLYKLLHCSILLLFGALEVYIDRILLTRYLHRFYFLCFHVVHKCSTRAPPFGNKPYNHTDVWCSLSLCMNLSLRELASQCILWIKCNTPKPCVSFPCKDLVILSISPIYISQGSNIYFEVKTPALHFHHTQYIRDLSIWETAHSVVITVKENRKTFSLTSARFNVTNFRTHIFPMLNIPDNLVLAWKPPQPI